LLVFDFDFVFVFGPPAVGFSSQALWECGKRSFIAFSTFPSGRFTFLSFCYFFFLCGKPTFSSAFPQFQLSDLVLAS